MIIANFIHRTFRLRFQGLVGTGFTVDVSGREYLVTARHVVSGLHGTDQVELYGNGQWRPSAVRLVGHGPAAIDVSVIAPSAPISPPKLPVEASSNGLVYGQDVYFMGFPYNFLGNLNFTEQGYPLPFVKRATFSCFGNDTYLLDGHSNPGFSGGPVIFGSSGGTPTKIAAVISNNLAVERPILKEAAETELTYLYNTGIIEAFKIEHALALIEAAPIGPELSY